MVNNASFFLLLLLQPQPAATHACADSGRSSTLVRSSTGYIFCSLFLVCVSCLRLSSAAAAAATAATAAAATAATAAAATAAAAAAAAARMSFPYYTEFGVHYPTYIPPKDQADRLVDPKKKLAPACTTKCSIWVHEYSVCTPHPSAVAAAAADAACGAGSAVLLLLLLLMLLLLLLLLQLHACCDRLKARTDNRGNCSGQFEELQTCVDRCVRTPETLPWLRTSSTTSSDPWQPQPRCSSKRGASCSRSCMRLAHAPRPPGGPPLASQTGTGGPHPPSRGAPREAP
ncbi:hypothetical protein Esti_003756 [Eimeria stiedai]